MYSFSYLEPVCCSMSSSDCCFLTCIQVSQEAGQVPAAVCFPPCPPTHPQPPPHCFYCHFLFLEYLLPLSPYTFSDPPVFPFFGSAQISPPPGSLSVSSKLKQNQSSLPLSMVSLRCSIQVRLPNVQWSQTNWHIRAWSRERFIAEPNKDNGQLVWGRGFISKIQRVGFKGVWPFLWLVDGR